jgi:hypothetical protein
MFDKTHDGSATLLDRVCAATRAENRAAGERLAAISEFDLLRLRQCGEKETWCTDTQEAVSAEIAAALQISTGWAANYLYYARSMRNRLPRLGAVLCAGDISYPMFRTIVYSTDLIADPEVMAAVDARLAARARRWSPMTSGRLASYVDKIVARADRDAVRQRRHQQADREFSIWDSPRGLTEVFGRLLTPDAHVVDARLDALAATVCAEDPRTRNQRRADAMGALAAGAARLQCRCGRSDCSAGAAVPRPVLIHVIAEQQTVDGASQHPGSLIGADALVPAELIAELADSARLQPLSAPLDEPAEPGYTPSSALADFIRCRDLTCRFPGCERPATECDIDHTIPYADGGATHASNLKTLCRQHHLLKTFWGWHDQQLPDGTVIWTTSSGQTYVTAPGSALLFPALMTPTGQLHQHRFPRSDRCGERTAMMPKRRRSRAQNHANYVAAERRRNRSERAARDAAARAGPAPPEIDDEPPPF